MMSSARLQPLQELAEHREEQAAEQLREAQQLLVQRQSQLQELARYRQDYEAASTVATPSLLRNRLAFIDKLREAERYQHGQVESARRQVEVARDHWTQQYRASATLDQLHANYQRREQQVLDRRAQTQLDELALRQHQQKQASSR